MRASSGIATATGTRQGTRYYSRGHTRATTSPPHAAQVTTEQARLLPVLPANPHWDARFKKAGTRQALFIETPLGRMDATKKKRSKKPGRMRTHSQSDCECKPFET